MLPPLGISTESAVDLECALSTDPVGSYRQSGWSVQDLSQQMERPTQDPDPDTG